jgi:uncharacterized protein (UPF0548 family)
MFLLRRPDPQWLQSLRTRHADRPLSYGHPRCTRGDVPPGFTVDRYRVCLGHGEATFLQARRALQDWRMMRLGWLEPCWQAELRCGELAGVLAHLYGLWSVNLCRMVDTFDEPGPIARFGFAYGTLAEHVEQGEERFTVEWRMADNTVWYEILAISRPRHWLARLGYPLTRRLQRRFGRESLLAMQRAVAHPAPAPGALA